MSNTNDPKKQTLTVLTIGSAEFLIPNGSDVAAVLKALAGLRKLRSDHFIYTEREAVCDIGPAEYSIASWYRENVSAEEMEQLRKAEDSVQKKRWAENDAALKAREKGVAA